MRLTTSPGQFATIDKFTTLALSIHAIRFPYEARRQQAAMRCAVAELPTWSSRTHMRAPIYHPFLARIDENAVG